MKRIHVLGLAFAAVFALCAVSVGSAFGAPEWLVKGAAVTATLAAETEGALTLIQLTKASGEILNEIKCEGIFDGEIGPNGADQINEVLNLAMEAISKVALSGLALECKVENGGLDESTDCKLGTTALVWAIHLPWKTQLELMEAPAMLLDLLGPIANGNPGYYVECESNFLGIKGTEECEGATSTLVENDLTTSPASVLGVFSEAESELGTCKSTGTELTAVTIGEGNTWDGTGLVREETAVND
jgi:hypothetical protein